MQRLILIFAMLAVSAMAQTAPINIRNVGCFSASEPLVGFTVPVMVSAVFHPLPVCVSLGAGLKLNTTTLKLEIDPAALPAPPAANVPRQAVHTLSLENVPQSAGINSIQFNLAFTPAPGSTLVVSYRSSRLGGDVVDFVPAGPSGDMAKVVVFLLPAHRPLIASDVVKILYWTFDPLPPA